MTIERIRKSFDIVVKDIGQLATDHYYFQKFNEYVKESTTIDKKNEFLWFVGLNYINSAVMKISNQVDNDKNSINLLNVLNDLKDNASMITREWYLKNLDPIVKSSSEEDFKTYSVADNTNLSEEKLVADITLLKDTIIGGDIKNKTIKTIKKYRNKILGHHSKVPYKIELNWGEFDKAVDLLDKLAVKYDLLLNHSAWVDDTLVDTDCDDFLNFEAVLR